MATPYGHSGDTLSTEPSRTLLQKLLEEINGAPTPTASRNRSSSIFSQPPRTRPVWVGGASIAEDARRKLRAADEARMRHGTSNAMDGTASSGNPVAQMGSSPFHRHSVSVIGHVDTLYNASPPDPVSRPHDYLRFMSLSHEYSAETRPTAGELHLETSFLDPPVSSDSSVARPLSPLIFSDVDFETGSSYSGNSVSPTEAPTSATTITGDHPKTPSDAGSTQSNKRAFSFPPEPDTLSKRTRTMTMQSSHDHVQSPPRAGRRPSRSSVDGNIGSPLHDSPFTESVTPRASVGAHYPADVSSFRPGCETSRGQPAIRAGIKVPPPSRNPSASPELPDTPPWMRPMHLIDTDDMSIYKTTHGNNLRYSLCLHCFSQHGDFCKVLTHGYETCGRYDVLKSHYWESNAWPEESDADE